MKPTNNPNDREHHGYLGNKVPDPIPPRGTDKSTGAHSLGGNKPSLLEKIKNEPVLISTLVSALVIFLVSILGVDQVQAENAVNLILYFLVTLGVGAGAGVGARQYVDGPKKRKLKNRD